MSTTPPPPSRVRTPPAPFHGSRYDNWEPYSPRRSTRVSSMRTRAQSPDAGPASMQRPLFSMTSTPRTSSLKRVVSSQTLSPPSSPDSEHKVATPAHAKAASSSSSVRRSLFTSHQHPSLDPRPSHLSDSLHDDKPSPEGVFPTPSRTPRKRAVATMPTARILNFKPANVDDVMPTPRKKKSRLTLFAEDAPKHDETISVFTDAQDRVPDVDNSDDNPFAGPRKRGAKPKVRATPLHGDEADMSEAVRNEEGLLYVFRGKKIFRPFVPAKSELAHDDQVILRRKAGVSAQRPLTRSVVQPRLLWPSQEQILEKQAREAALHEDEEADTDIEEEHISFAMPNAVNDLVTPAKPPFHLAHVMTPPSSHTRSASKKMAFMSNFGPVPEIAEPNAPISPSATPLPQSKTKKVSPFETWKRTKSSVSGPSSHSHGKKRALSPQPDMGTKRFCKPAPNHEQF